MLNNRWLILIVLLVARATMGFQFQAVPSVAPLIMKSLHLNYTQLGLLAGVYMLPGVFLAVPGAFTGSFLGDKRAVLIGLAMMTLGGAAMAVSPSLAYAMAARAVGGTGAILLNIHVTKMVTEWFAGREMSTALALLMTTWPGGLALGLAVEGPVAAHYSWEAASAASALFPLLAMLLVAWLYRDAPDAARVSRGQGVSHLRLNRAELKSALGAGAMWMIFNGGFIILVTFAPIYLVEQGVPLSEAGLLSSILPWILIGSVSLGGYLADRTGKPHWIITTGTIATALFSWSLAWVPVPLVAFVLIGATLGLSVGPLTMIGANAVPAARRAVGLGIFFTGFYIAMAVSPSIAGYIQDVTKRGAVTLGFGGGLVLLTAFGLAGFRRMRGVAEVDA